MKNRQLSLNALLGLTLLSMTAVSLSAQVKVEEKIYTIPSYEQQAPNPMPRFFEGRSHQGVQRRMYPYPFDDGLTDNKRDQDYSMVHMENEFIDLAVSAELGGRVYYADDKTNGYNYLYHNHVVKPSLIGMLGNWISGSLAWGYPHHHGPNTVEAMSYVIEEGEDGSCTVWVRSWDRYLRLSVIVGYTIYPDSSLLEMTIHPQNRTSLANSFLFWSNPAVHCDENYQVIFPPSVKYVTYHGKNQMTSWPIADSRFNNYDFTGIDISWWKNTFVPSSFFSWDPRENYFGGYDHKEHAGTVWVGNRHVSPGMKYWADGNNANGLNTNEGLTDNDGRYIELMAGFYTDNQPDYSWLQPYETKIGTMAWFPVRNLDGLIYANREGAMNYFLEGSNLDIRLNTTRRHNNAKLVVEASGKVIFEKTFLISPADPVKQLCTLPAAVGENDLNIALYDDNGELLYNYRPAEHDIPDYDKPEPVKSYPKPEEMASVEELYLAGLRLDQFYNASVDPMPYYLEALKRDPGNYDVNTQLGIKAIKAYDWVSAEKYFRTAVERVSYNYTRPRDGEALYYLGLTLKALGRLDEAYDELYKASWSYAWHTASYFQLAEIDCIRGHYEVALEHVNLSISTGTDNARSQTLKAYILRKLGREAEARTVSEALLKSVKIDFMALNELYLAGGRKEDLAELERQMLDDEQLYLELAFEYAEFRAYDEAKDILLRLTGKGNKFPMLYYTLGYFDACTGDEAAALEYYRQASSLPTDYCYPFRTEAVEIFADVMKRNPSDARAPYYLGNLYYELRPDLAVELWKKSVELDPDFYITYRNLAWAYKENYKDYPVALEYMNKAIACNNKDARLLYELDELNDLNKLSPKAKYDVLKKNIKVAKTRSETTLRLATRAVEAGKYLEAIDIMDNNFIIESEGAREKQDNYLNSYSILALDALKSGQLSKAERYINSALDYPIGLYGRTMYARLYYIAGLVQQKRGNDAKAKEYFGQSAAVVIERQNDSEFNYYKAMSMIALGRSSEGKALLQKMLDGVSASGGTVFLSQFGSTNTAEDKRISRNYYTSGLAYLGLGDKAKAKECFNSAVEYNPGNIWGAYYAKQK